MPEPTAFPPLPAGWHYVPDGNGSYKPSPIPLGEAPAQAPIATPQAPVQPVPMPTQPAPLQLAPQAPVPTTVAPLQVMQAPAAPVLQSAVMPVAPEATEAPKRGRGRPRKVPEGPAPQGPATGATSDAGGLPLIGDVIATAARLLDASGFESLSARSSDGRYRLTIAEVDGFEE